MNSNDFHFWTCPGCVHVSRLNLNQMTNRCQLIDQGTSPIDGKIWEYQDLDHCPGFQPEVENVTDISF